MVVAFVLALPLTGLAAHPATAADRQVLKVLGTSDVSDSNLMRAVIEPGFEAANPDIDLQYTGTASGAAITQSQAGNASALIVHAAALENQFVAGGYSLEPYGRAVFWGDYVLVGPPDDPAGVLNGSTHDIAGAFQKVAAAGAQGKASFLSRGSTPGTTVQEHAIWAVTSGVALCTVRPVDGGGKTPVVAADNGTNCPAINSQNSPSWYSVAAGNQAANVQRGESCNGLVGCYVFTDRGTYNYLQSTGAVTRLQVVTRNNDTLAPGGKDLLVNSFHAYVINPAAVPANSNLRPDLATRFLDYLVSPGAQAAVSRHLNASNDPPFIPAAAPLLTVSGIPATVPRGTTLTVAGSLKNAIPGTPNLDNVPVRLMARPVGIDTVAPRLVAVGSTNALGLYSIAYKPSESLRYYVDVSPITKIEIPTLTPVFGDLLQGVTSPLTTATVVDQLAVTKVQSVGRRLKLQGTVLPSAGQPGTVTITAKAKKKVKGQKSKVTKKITVPAGGTTFKTTLTFGRGTYKYTVTYLNAGNGTTSATPPAKVTFS